MQLNDLLTRLTIPTGGMERFTPRYSQHWHEARLTTFFRDKGQLHWPHGDCVQTATVFFVQREDGLMRVVVAGVEGSMRPLLADCLDPNIKTQVIECKVPLRDVDVSNLIRLYVEEPLAFVGSRHPVHQSRVDALAILLNDSKKEVY